VKYVILIHSNPDPWGHPTDRYTAEGRMMSDAWHEETDRRFDALLREISASGELVTAEALAAPETSTIYTWTRDGGGLATEGPYAEAKEQLAGFFLLDCESADRAREIAAQFAGPGSVIELRPAMWAGGPDA
jgi:hypothetical protein